MEEKDHEEVHNSALIRCFDALSARKREQEEQRPDAAMQRVCGLQPQRSSRIRTAASPLATCMASNFIE
jgi:hypothetical protein